MFLIFDFVTLVLVTMIQFHCSISDRMKFRLDLHHMLMGGQRLTMAMLSLTYGFFWFQVSWAPFDEPKLVDHLQGMGTLEKGFAGTNKELWARIYGEGGYAKCIGL